MLNGQFKTRNFVEGIILALPFLGIFIYGWHDLGWDVQSTVAYCAILCAAAFLGAAHGVGGDSLFEFIQRVIRFRQSRRISKYNPRIKTELEPEYLIHDGRMLPKDKLKQMLGTVKGKVLGEENGPISSDITDEELKVFYDDDYGFLEKPDALKSKAELRAEAKQRAKEEKEYINSLPRSERKAAREEIKRKREQEEAEKKAKDEAPLIKEAHEMLVKWEHNDPEVRALWEKMNSWVYAGFDETYKALGVGFDKIYYESQTYLEGKAKVEEGLKKGLFFRKEDNSVWADLSDEGLDQKLLLRSDGTSVYMTQDIGTAEMRFNDYPIDKMIYVVGNEQNYHFQVLSILLDRLGFKWGKELVHFSYGMVELPNGKMKSREGTVVDADDLIAAMIDDARRTSEELGKFADMSDEERAEVARIVGMGALKYFILKVDARKNMLFNPEESIDFNGNTGPFIQYTYARIRSILRKAEAQGITLPETFSGNVNLSVKESELIQKMNEYGAAVRQAGIDYSPSGIANYCYELTKEFNQFYHDFSILGADTEDEKILRLLIAKNVAKTLKNGMRLLGIEMPERM